MLRGSVLPALLAAATVGTVFLTGNADAAPQVTGLTSVCGGQFTALACQSEIAVSGGNTKFTSTGPTGWGAPDLEKAHGLSGYSPGNGTIAIIDVGADPNLESDLNTYRSQYHLPSCTTANACFHQIDYHGGPALPPATTPTDKAIDEEIAFETSLDVDMASAACPHCKITEVQIPDSAIPTVTPGQPIDYDGYADAFGTAAQTAITHGAAAISISYGLPGDTHMTTGPLAADFNHRGVAITASSGDSGFAGPAYAWPQALPTVTSVGGTELVEQSGIYVEGAWADAGSGCAPGVTPATGEPAAAIAACHGSRASTDVSAVADNLAIYDSYTPSSGHQYGWLVGAGTSASSPFIAGMYAASGQVSDVLGPNTLYQHPWAFNDVTSGTNAQLSDANGDCRTIPTATTPSQTFAGILCQSQHGWDGPTGLGTPRGLSGF